MIEKQYFKVSEVANYLRVHPATVRRMIHDKKIKALRLKDESYRIPESALNDFTLTNTN
jgi:excisionase family DNA binding protein